MNNQPLTPTQIDEYTRTVEAAAWLLPLAQASVDKTGWPPELVDWLDRVGSTHFDALQRSKH